MINIWWGKYHSIAEHSSSSFSVFACTNEGTYVKYVCNFLRKWVVTRKSILSHTSRYCPTRRRRPSCFVSITLCLYCTNTNVGGRYNLLATMYYSIHFVYVEYKTTCFTCILSSYMTQYCSSSSAKFISCLCV